MSKTSSIFHFTEAEKGSEKSALRCGSCNVSFSAEIEDRNPFWLPCCGYSICEKCALKLVKTDATDAVCPVDGQSLNGGLHGPSIIRNVELLKHLACLQKSLLVTVEGSVSNRCSEGQQQRVLVRQPVPAKPQAAKKKCDGKHSEGSEVDAVVFCAVCNKSLCTFCSERIHGILDEHALVPVPEPEPSEHAAEEADGEADGEGDEAGLWSWRDSSTDAEGGAAAGAEARPSNRDSSPRNINFCPSSDQGSGPSCTNGNICPKHKLPFTCYCLECSSYPLVCSHCASTDHCEHTVERVDARHAKCEEHLKAAVHSLQEHDAEVWAAVQATMATAAAVSNGSGSTTGRGNGLEYLKAHDAELWCVATDAAAAAGKSTKGSNNVLKLGVMGAVLGGGSAWSSLRNSPRQGFEGAVSGGVAANSTSNSPRRSVTGGYSGNLQSANASFTLEVPALPTRSGLNSGGNSRQSTLGSFRLEKATASSDADADAAMGILEMTCGQIRTEFARVTSLLRQREAELLAAVKDFSSRVNEAIDAHLSELSAYLTISGAAQEAAAFAVGLNELGGQYYDPSKFMATFESVVQLIEAADNLRLDTASLKHLTTVPKLSVRFSGNNGGARAGIGASAVDLRTLISQHGDVDCSLPANSTSVSPAETPRSTLLPVPVPRSVTATVSGIGEEAKVFVQFVPTVDEAHGPAEELLSYYVVFQTGEGDDVCFIEVPACEVPPNASTGVVTIELDAPPVSLFGTFVTVRCNCANSRGRAASSATLCDPPAAANVYSVGESYSPNAVAHPTNRLVSYTPQPSVGDAASEKAFVEALINPVLPLNQVSYLKITLTGGNCFIGVTGNPTVVKDAFKDPTCYSLRKSRSLLKSGAWIEGKRAPGLPKLPHDKNVYVIKFDPINECITWKSITRSNQCDGDFSFTHPINVTASNSWRFCAQPRSDDGGFTVENVLTSKLEALF